MNFYNHPSTYCAQREQHILFQAYLLLPTKLVPVWIAAATGRDNSQALVCGGAKITPNDFQRTHYLF